MEQPPELYLEQPPRLPRVYAAAPSGVDVTVVRAGLVVPGTTTRTPVLEPRFSLHRSAKTDYRFFNIDERHGNITTSRWVFSYLHIVRLSVACAGVGFLASLCS